MSNGNLFFLHLHDFVIWDHLPFFPKQLLATWGPSYYSSISIGVCTFCLAATNLIFVARLRCRSKFRISTFQNVALAPRKVHFANCVMVVSHRLGLKMLL